VRTGGRGKHNFLSGGAPASLAQKIAVAKKEAAKARAGKNSFPQTPSFLPACIARFAGEPPILKL